MNILYVILILFFTIAKSTVAADSIAVKYNISGKCQPSTLREKYVGTPDMIKTLIATSFELESINEIRFMMSKDGKVLQVNVSCADKIVKVIYKTSGVSEGFVQSNFFLGATAWLKNITLDLKKRALYSALQHKGFSNIVIEHSLPTVIGGKHLELVVQADSPPSIGGISFLTPGLVEKIDLQSLLYSYVGEEYRKSLGSQILVDIKRSLNNHGIFFIRLKEVRPFVIKGKIFLRYSVELGSRIGISVSGDSGLERELKNFLKERLFIYSNDIQKKDISSNVQDFLHLQGLYNVHTNIRIEQGYDLKKYPILHTFINLRAGHKVKINKISFVGVDKQQEDDLLLDFFQNGPDLIKSHYYDANYVDGFAAFVKKKLLSIGILYVKISTPSIVYSSNGKSLSIQYVVQRGDQFLLKSMVTNVDVANKQMNSYGLVNKVGSPFNPLELKSDLQKLLQQVLNMGYFYAKYESLIPEKIVKYDLTSNAATVNIFFQNMIKTRVSDYILIGNRKTKQWVVDKLLRFERDTLLTPSLLSNLKYNLLRSGLFATVEIQNIYDETRGGEDYYRLVIKVEEKKAGRLVFSPGYRTDLGLKAEVQVYYGNLLGENKTASLNMRVNRRMNNTFDEIRSSIADSLLEYNIGIRYQDPFVFKTSVEYDTKIGAIRERYYSFDADIERLSTNFRKRFGKHFTLSFSHQLERVRQYNADSAINEASFRIGSLTPKLTLDYRDNPIRPKKGVKIDLSWEFANPYFLAMSNDDLIINYNKIIMRNTFYIPTSFGTIAFMAALGAQKNFATEPLLKNGSPVFWEDGTTRLQGYIPSIKVFRLEGSYNVRGYSFDESNKLTDGVDISTRVIQDMAYFSVFKVEPRYFYSDNIVMALFFDAGRVFYEKFQPLKVRTSVGVSFKYVTPVGTIDLDYGVKLHRVKGGDLNESFGHLHFAIGFF